MASDFHWVRSAEETTTLASTIDAAVTEVGLGGNGKRSAVPVLGGVNTERGKAGGALCFRVLGLRGVGGTDIWWEGGKREILVCDKYLIAPVTRPFQFSSHLSLHRHRCPPSLIPPGFSPAPSGIHAASPATKPTCPRVYPSHFKWLLRPASDFTARPD